MSANAIETLRRYYALNDREYRDALDAVEALLEAAKAVCFGDKTAKDDADLAAAVLRVESGQ